MTEEIKKLKVGTKMPDGTIFAGISPDTDKPMYVMAEDESVTMTFNEAAKFSGGLNKYRAYGHKGWRVPTKAELNVLFQNCEKGALKGTFNLAGLYGAGFYWSSTPGDLGVAWYQRFSDGVQRDYASSLTHKLSVRCVRD